MEARAGAPPKNPQVTAHNIQIELTYTSIAHKTAIANCANSELESAALKHYAKSAFTDKMF